MQNGALIEILALIPPGMQVQMEELAAAAAGRLQQFTSVVEMIHDSAGNLYAVAIVPATGFSPEEWWTIWGYLSGMDPRPCILIYALRSDFGLWSSILDAGAFDLIVAPFTADKLRRAILSASEEFARRNSQ